MRFTTVADGEAAAMRAAQSVAREVSAAVAARGVAHLALAGGSTPRRCHEHLAPLIDDWMPIHIWLSDERAVPPNDDDSNFKMVCESLLDRIDIPAGNVHRPRGEDGAEVAADGYETDVRETVGGNGAPALDVIMCGLGEDGHTCSLFPGHDEIHIEDRLVAPVHDAPKPPPDRITFTFPLLHAARRLILLAAGASKADAMAAVIARPDPHVPASLLRFGRLEVIADDAAVPARIRPRA